MSEGSREGGGFVSLETARESEAAMQMHIEIISVGCCSLVNVLSHLQFLALFMAYDAENLAPD